MSADPERFHAMIRTAREALRRGDEAEARRWAEQAARLAPDLEDAWLVLTAVSGPRESLEYARRALAINPNSQRARKAVEWARSRPGAAEAMVGAAGRRSAREAKKKPKRRGPLYAVLLAGLACAVVAFAAWSVSRSSALASIVSRADSPVVPTSTQELRFVAAELDKPTYTPVWTSTPTPTLTPTFTVTPSITPTLEYTSTPLPTDTPGVMEAAIVPDTPTSVAPPTKAYAAPTQQASVPSGGGSSGGVRWIDVNLSTQRLYAYEGDVIVRTFIVSTGVWATPTVTGKYKIYARYTSARMRGPGYDLPNVPYVMYFHKSYGIHGTYWHNNFGTPMSHGCVNMSIPDAEWLYYWSAFGTTVNVHY